MTAEHRFPSVPVELGREECLRLLATRSVGRIAFADRVGPDIIPVNYVLDDDAMLVATSAYGPLARSAIGARVAVEVDHVDEGIEGGWSVVVRGTAVPRQPGQIGVTLPRPWADGVRTLVLGIEPVAISGRRLVAR